MDELKVNGDEVGFISRYDDQSYGMFCPVAIVQDDGYRNLFAASLELLKSLERLSAQCARLRLPGQPKSDAEKSAEAVIAKAKGQ